MPAEKSGEGGRREERRKLNSEMKLEAKKRDPDLLQLNELPLSANHMILRTFYPSLLINSER